MRISADASRARHPVRRIAHAPRDGTRPCTEMCAGTAGVRHGCPWGRAGHAATRNQASRATQEVPRRGDHHNSRKGVLFCLPFPPVPVSRLGGCARRRSTPAPRVFVVRPGGVHPALGHRPGRPSPCQGMRKRTTNRQDPHAVYAAGPRPPRAQRTPPARCPVRHQSTESMIRSTWIALSLGITIQSEPSAT